MKIFMSLTILFLTCVSEVVGAGVTDDERVLKRMQERIVQTELRLNQAEIKTYLIYVKLNKIIIPIYSLGSEFTSGYMERNAAVKKTRMAFEVADSLMQQVLLKDAVYREVDSLLRAGGHQSPDYQRNIKRKQDVFSRLHRTNEAYRLAREKREDALWRSNVLLFEVLAKEFEKEKLVLNLPFLDGKTRQVLESMDPRIVLLKTEVQVLREKHVKLLHD